MLRFRTSDDKIIEVRRNIFDKSWKVNDQLAYGVLPEIYSLPEVHSQTLNKIILFLQLHEFDPPGEKGGETPVFYTDVEKEFFNNLGRDNFVKLFKAASNLEISILQRSMARHMAALAHGKSPEQMKNFFEMGLGEDEEEQEEDEDVMDGASPAKRLRTS